MLERHYLARQFFEEMSQWLSAASVLLKERSLVGDIIIEAPFHHEKNWPTFCVDQILKTQG
ncbi:hypothetical protein MnBA_11000 [Marinobacterium sp. BA1]